MNTKHISIIVLTIYLLGFLAGRATADDASMNWADDTPMTNEAFLKSIEGVTLSSRVEPKPVIKDVTPKTDCEQGGMVDGVGHQETKVCMDSAPAIRDMEVDMNGKLVRWKGNPNVGYYKLRDDGSIDSGHWRSSITGVSA